EAKEELPYKGSIVQTAWGEAEVTDVDPLGGQVTVEIDDESYVLDKDEVEEIARDKSKSR
ncbi:MAG: hypothetical protein GX177_05385, partial [Firmicutes bacterium]|nr:hypothetical protein [Bacillota bacterium]